MDDPTVKRKTHCRGCDGADLEVVLSLGATPLANAFLRADALPTSEPSFPLDLQLCHGCGFVQLADVVSPEILFRNYVYVSSTSPVFVAHFQRLAEEVGARIGLRRDALVVDIGSNDGILLRPFRDRGMRVLGVDPAVRIAEEATRGGIETLPTFFSARVAEEIVGTKGKASLVTATSVFPHVDDLDDLVGGVRLLLADDGVFLVEAYYLGDLVEQNLFDTVYHEHLSYFSVRTMRSTLARLGMDVFDVQKTETHGGSLRVFAQRTGGPRATSATLAGTLAAEARLGLDRASTYRELAARIERNKEGLLALLRRLKGEGATIAGYGAPAKGNTLMNCFGIGRDLLEYVVDDSPWKQGLYTPGTRLRVDGAERLRREPPGYLLILAWNFADAIMKKCSAFREAGGRFILPVPEPRVV